MRHHSKHKFPYKWYLKNGYPAKGIIQHNCKVFGTFICGGGSSMGYKLAGYNHLGGVEIDKKVADVYKLNHNPKHLYIEDLRDFNNRNNLPKELYNLDLLDGSPPCSSFSMAGNREKDWGKKKQFREGQTLQRLDDLVYVYLDTIEKLMPKVALLENVKGLIQGNAKSYAKKMFKRFKKIGYKVQLFCLNAASMGVPQKRERVFFIGLRNDFKLSKLVLNFNERPILFGDIDEKNKKGIELTNETKFIWMQRAKNDKSLADIHLRINGKSKRFSAVFVKKNQVPNTLVGGADSVPIKYDIPFRVSMETCRIIGAYPLDYNFKNIKPNYLIGMSVPPIMTAQIANQIYKQWLSKINGKQYKKEAQNVPF